MNKAVQKVTSSYVFFLFLWETYIAKNNILINKRLDFLSHILQT